MIDDLIKEIHSAGWLFNNCYQYDPGLWRVNLRRPNGEDGAWFTDWAEAPTLEEALTICMDKLAQAEYFESQAQAHSIDKSQPTNRTFLESLGLLKQKAPLVRRI